VPASFRLASVRFSWWTVWALFGNWTGQVAARSKVGAIVMIDILLAWTAAAVYLGGRGAGLW
jgi:hypothetical protein